MRLAFLLVFGFIGSAHADSSCVVPLGADQLPKILVDGLHVIGKRTVVLDARVMLADLTLHVAKRFMADHVGAKTGTWVTDLVGEVAGKQDTTTVPGTLRIGSYRITARTAGSAYALVIEDGVCAPALDTKPLAIGESRSYWISTEGTTAIHLMNAESWNSSDYLELYLGFGFAHNGGYRPYLNLTLLRQTAGATDRKELDFSDDVPAPFKLVDHRVEIVQVVWGPNTKRVQGEIEPVETVPVAHILVRLTRQQ